MSDTGINWYTKICTDKIYIYGWYPAEFKNNVKCNNFREFFLYGWLFFFFFYSEREQGKQLKHFYNIFPDINI